jgi:hypothetical protein
VCREREGERGERGAKKGRASFFDGDYVDVSEREYSA